MTAVNWMPKYYKSKFHNPNDPDISISTQHTDIIGFSCTISQKNTNHQIFQYSKKHKNLKEQRKIHQIPWNEKKCAENAKISGKICEKNTQHDMINQ
jgi:hypothetical protein